MKSFELKNPIFRAPQPDSICWQSDMSGPGPQPRTSKHPSPQRRLPKASQTRHALRGRQAGPSKSMFS